jgi:hypothetical protein
MQLAPQFETVRADGIDLNLAFWDGGGRVSEAETQRRSSIPTACAILPWGSFCDPSAESCGRRLIWKWP